MPYTTVKNGDSYDVYKQGADGKTTGKALNKKPMTKAQADKYSSALYANEGKSLTEVEIVAIEEKCYSDDSSYINKLSPDDPRANYDAMGGRTGDRACANCRWFHPGSASCDLIWGEKVASGVSDLWLSAETPRPTNQPAPIPVVIVEPDDVDAGAMAVKAGDPADYAYVPDKETPSTWKLPIGDEKHARLALAAIGSNPPHGNKVDIPADAMPGVRKKIEAAIRKFVTDKNEVKRLLGGKSLLEQFVDFLGIKSTEDTGEGFKVLPDGRWQAWWTNNAKDRTGEWFSAKAIDDYIARVDSGKVPYPELWYKHLPVRMGKADCLARIGYLTFATGTFYDTPTGQKGRAYYEAEQKAGKPHTNSHGYLYPTNLLKKGVYNAFNTFEITVLDPGEEANAYTYFEVKSMFAKLDQDQKKLDELEKIFGKEAVTQLTNFAEKKSAELEQSGVEFKSFSSFDGVEVEDKTAHAAVKALGEATLEGLKAINTRLDAITESVKAVQTSVDEKVSASAKAVADLKAYVQGELGYTPRASKAAESQLAATDAQVAHLEQKNAEAAQNKGNEATPEGVSEFGKGIFAEIAKAMSTPS